MRVLLDECVPARLRAAFPGHAVRTVTEAGWRSTKDTPLLALAAGHFDVFVTVDRKLEREQDLCVYRLGIVLARGPDRKFVTLRAIFDELKAAAERVNPGELIVVTAPWPR